MNLFGVWIADEAAAATNTALALHALAIAILLQAKTAPLQQLCGSQVAAESISAAAGQAVSAAIPPAFGSNPCNIFQG